MDPKYVYELTTQQKQFIRNHKKMSTTGLAQLLRINTERVKWFREVLLKNAS